MKPKRRLLRPRARIAATLALLCCAALLRAGPALAQGAITPEAKAEARERYDRGMRLFNDGDNAAAIAEWKRVYELVPNPVVLYNIGLGYAAMGRPVLAVEALTRLIAAPGALSAERLERAKATRDEQSARIAAIAVVANVEGAAIEIDNIEVAKTPLGAPISVASGTHVVSVVAPGYSPSRKEVTIAGRARADLTFELSPMQGRIAKFAVTSRLPGVEIVIDGIVSARTPLATSLSLAPGRHVIDLRRPGYVSARRELDLGDGSTTNLPIDLEEDAAALAEEGGSLVLAISEPQAVLTLDGRARGAYVSSLRVAHGVHRLRVERAGFLSFERDITVPRAASSTITVTLQPTPETLAAYTNRARLHRTWGIVGIAAGAALAGGGAGFLAYNAGQKRDAQAQLDAIELERTNDTGPCDTSGGKITAEECNNLITAREAARNNANARDAIGYVGIGVGAAALVTGIVLLATGDDLHRYEPPASGEPLAKLRVTPIGWATPQGGGLGVVGLF